MNNDEKLITILEKLNISYTIYNHEPIRTVQDAIDKNLEMPGLNLKNLLIKDKKNNEFYLVILDDKKQFDSKKFKEATGTKKISFASEEELFNLLKLTPGEVGPFGLINEDENKVKVVFELELYEAKDEELVNFHPNRNDGTIALTKKDFLKYLNHLQKEIYVLK